MQVIQFANGKFGVRRRRFFFGYKFLSRYSHTWHSDSTNAADYSQFETAEAAEKQLRSALLQCKVIKNL